jgi:hypothetical protein
MTLYGEMPNIKVVRIIKASKFSFGVIFIRVSMWPMEPEKKPDRRLPDGLRPEAKDEPVDASRQLYMEKWST